MGNYSTVVADKVHTHTKANITDFPTSMPASDVSSWAKAASKPSYVWSEIGSKPAAYPPDFHTHLKAQISDFPASMPASDVSAWAKAATKPSYTYNEVGAAAAGHHHDSTYLGITAQAADSDKLDGVHLADIRIGQNILHNWDFTNPVNQRSVVSGWSSGYGIDRWTKNNAGRTIDMISDGMRVNTGVGSVNVRQLIEFPQKYSGKTVTFSANIVAHTGGCSMRIWTDGTNQAGIGGITTTGIVSFTCTLPTIATDLSVLFYLNEGTSLTIASVKLELGTESTLHLDPPMDHAVEFPKCQRFALKIERTYTAGISYNTTRVRGPVYFPVPMRANPTLVSVGEMSAYNDSSVKTGLTEVSVYAPQNNCILIAGTSTFVAWRSWTLLISDIFLSADL